MAFYVVSERGHTQYVAWGISYEMEDIMARTCGAQILAPKLATLAKFHWKWDIIFARWLPYVKLQDFKFADEKNQLLLIGMGPGPLKMLETLGPWREKCETVAAYIMDVYQPGIDAFAKPRYRKITDKLDHLFVSYEQSVPKIQALCKCPVSLILQGADALTHGAHGGERPVDVISYGRRFPDTHKALQQAFNYPLSPRLYYHSTFKFRQYPDAENYIEHRQLFYQMLRRSKIALNYRYTQTTAWNAKGICPLTARWFEAVAAGAVIVGTKPVGPEAAREFDWPDAVIDFPDPNNDPAGFITSILEDKDRLARTSRLNYLNALRRHDWRYRIRDMMLAMKMPLPAAFQADLDALEAKAKKVESEPV